MRVLVVEDNIALAKTMKSGLEGYSFQVDVCHMGLDGEELASINDYDVILLDLNLPDVDGLEVLNMLRESTNNTPIIIISARDGLTDRTKGLNLGADDYITKPFELVELNARINAVVRRYYGRSSSSVKVGNLELDSLSRTVVYADTRIDLKPKEFDILEFIIMKHPEVVSTEAIAEHVYDETFDPFSSVLRVHMARIRKKLNEVSEHDLLITIRGKGYQLCED
ncbi:response regulator transcription factor [Erysipelothrix sp. HDW6C]|uniref:response regulator transcription factor n=1 Tax=Erysipelothrix sp. HDW6C TaxID=2714930 RepID=UPI00140BC112|nr:response regulator transcription factor [Erysipelothrix sp. HDW6C]QIK70591.1 response regulator transcription factor [Erysipelothrix sp. HDW6C]